MAEQRLILLLGTQASKPAIRAAVFAAINARRSQVGLPALQYLGGSAVLADEWAETTKDGPYAHDTDPGHGYAVDMAALGCLPPLDGYSPSIAEAIHWGSNGTPAEIANRVVSSWMSSNSHKPILLEPTSTWGGIGLAYSSTSQTWAVVLRTTSSDCSNLTN